MSAIPSPIGLFPGVEILRRNWGWIVAVGVAQILLGAVSLAASVFVTVVSVILFGWLLFTGGILAVVNAFREKGWNGFLLDLAIGVLYSVAGLMVVSHPVAAAANLTLVIALFLMVGGLLRIVAAIAGDFHHRIVVLLNGIVTLCLGVMIWRDWPVSGLWVIGLFIGVDLIAYGLSLVSLGLSARKLPT